MKKGHKKKLKKGLDNENVSLFELFSEPLKCNDLNINALRRLLRDPVWIRTKDLQLRRLLLYPAELRDHF